MKYNLENSIKDAGSCIFWRERLVKRDQNFKWYNPVHEYILFSGKVTKVDISITHKKTHRPTRRNLDIFDKYIDKGNELSARDCFYYARELFQIGEIDKAAKYYEKFLQSKGGVRSNYLDACIELSKCFARKGDEKNSLKTLLRYFEIDSPRAEIFCELGYYYKEKKRIQ